MPCSCRCGHLCPQGFLWCNLYTTNPTHLLSSQSTHIAVSKVTKDHQCNAMGKTLSRNLCLCIIKRFWHHFTHDSLEKRMWSSSPTYWLGLPSYGHRLQPWSRHCANQIPQKYSVRSRWTRFCWWYNIRQTLERHPGNSGAIRRSYVRGKRFLENVRYDFTFLHLVPCNCFGVESTYKPGNDYVISSTRRPLLTTCNFAAWILIWSTITKISLISGRMMKIT